MGRFFREFAVTLSAAILVSLVVSLTTTPMMCARLLVPAAQRRASRFHRWSERGFAAVLRGYERTLAWALDHGPLTALVLLATVALNVYALRDRAQGLLPAAGHGPAHGPHPGRSEHLVPGDAREARHVHRHRARRPERRERRRLHRRQPAQHRVDVRHAEAARRARGERRPDRGAAAQPARAGARRRASSSTRSRTYASAAGRAAPRTSTRSRPTTSRICGSGSRASARRSRACPSLPTSTPISRTRGSPPRSSSIATPRRASA